MDALQRCLEQFLASLLVDTPITPVAVAAWWREQRSSPEESMAEFLRRKKVFGEDAPRTLDLIAKGYLAPSCRATLLAPEGLETLLHQLRPKARATPPVLPSRMVPPSPVAVSDTIRRPRIDAPGQSFSSTTSTGSRAPNRLRRPISAGTVLGKYLLTEQIGRGTSGIVFRAINQSLDLSVAVKVLRLGGELPSTEALASLQAEARLLACLNHPNIVRLWDFEADPEVPYLVMEYVEGPTLAELIQQCGRLSLERAVEQMIQVVDGLAAAWKLGVIHRDVKPHNILLTRSGQPKLADLGLAVVVSDRDDPAATGHAEAAVAGTAAYMAPEQGMLSGEPIDFRSDIYSLGATFYHVLTGELPFTGHSARELMVKHMQERPIPPHLRVPGLSEAVSNVVLTMMARDRDDRYQSAAELKIALSGLLVQAPEPASAPGITATLHGTPSRASGFFKRLILGM